jgi:hypothetical protein
LECVLHPQSVLLHDPLVPACCQVYSCLGVSSPRGVLLLGPSCCGKTDPVHATARGWVPLLRLPAPEVWRSERSQRGTACACGCSSCARGPEEACVCAGSRHDEDLELGSTGRSCCVRLLPQLSHIAMVCCTRCTTMSTVPSKLTRLTHPFTFAACCVVRRLLSGTQQLGGSSRRTGRVPGAALPSSSAEAAAQLAHTAPNIYHNLCHSCNLQTVCSALSLSYCSIV